MTFPATNQELAEFFGILTGDGYIGEYQERQALIIGITGNKIKDSDYLNNIVSSMVKNLFNLEPKIYHIKNQNTLQLTICSKGIFHFLRENGFRSGRKGEIVPPLWITSNKNYMAYFVRGFLIQTDVCV